MTAEATTEPDLGGEEKDQPSHIVKERVCDYYISARGCVKVASLTPLHAPPDTAARPVEPSTR